MSVADLPDGMHDRASFASPPRRWGQAELATTFEIDNHAFETGRVIGRLDLPVRGAIFIAREIIIVSGWALAPSGIRSIDVLIDGEPRGRIDYGASAARHRHAAPSVRRRRSLWLLRLRCRCTVWTSAATSSSVAVTANDGQQLELPTRIEIDSTTRSMVALPAINRHYRAWLERRAVRPRSCQ